MHAVMVSSFGAKLSTQRPPTNEPSDDISATTLPQVPDYDANLTIVPPTVLIEDCVDEKGKVTPWPLTKNECETTTYRRGRILVRERNLCFPPRSEEEAMRTRKFETGPTGWCIAPGNGLYDERKEYPWISREEMGIALDWVRNLPGTRGKHFLVHSIDNEKGIAITLRAKEPNPGIELKQPVHRRVLELRRGIEGKLTATPCHSIACVSRLAEEGILCVCENGRKQGRFEIPSGFLASVKSPFNLNACRNLSIDQMMEKLTVKADDTATPPTEVKVFGCRMERIEIRDEKLEGMMKRLAITTSPEDGKVTDLFDGSDGVSTPPTSPDAEKKQSVWVDEDLAKSGWRQDVRLNQERTYRCGKSRLSQRDLSRPWESDSEASRVRPFEELPEWSRVLDWDKGYKEGKIYPRLSRRETEVIISWCDRLPEYREGGYRFLLHQTEARTIAVSLIGDERDPKRSRVIGERVLELGRSKSGKLYEVFAVGTVSHGRYQETEEGRGTITETDQERLNYSDPQIQHSESESDITPSITTLHPSERINDPVLGTSTHPSTSDRTYSCLVTILDHERKGEGELAKTERNLDEERNDRIYVKVPPPNEYLQIWGNPREKHDCRIQQEIDQAFPVPQKIKYAPPTSNTSNGVFAAQAILPYAQNDDKMDFEFYAKGVTLVLDDEEGNPTYYHGKAAIRITQYDLEQDFVVPKRRRTAYLREKMFKMEPRNRSNTEKDNLRDRNALPFSVPDGTERPCDSNQTHTKTNPEATNESKPHMEGKNEEEEKAVKRAVVSDDLEEDYENGTYRLEQNDDGSFKLNRVVASRAFAEKKRTAAEEGEMNEERSDQDLEFLDWKGVTELGNDPHPSDWVIDAGSQIDGQNDWHSTTDPLATCKTGVQPQYNLPRGLKQPERKLRHCTEDIKNTRETHQSDTFTLFSPLSLSSSYPLDPLDQQPCPPRMSRKVPLNETPPNPFSQFLTSFQPARKCTNTAATHTVPHSTPPSGLPTGYSASVGGGDVIRPTTRGRLRPGLMAAASLEKVHRESSPHEHLFKGCGATLIYEDEEGQLQTRTGDTELRFFERDFQISENTPRPPPPQRVSEARVELFRYDLSEGPEDRFPGTRLRTIPDAQSSLRNLRLDPRVPVFEPRPGNQPTDDTPEPNRIRVDQGSTEREVAEALVNLSESKRVVDVPVTETSCAQEDSISSSGSDENPSKSIKFVYGGVIPGTLERSRSVSPSLRIMDIDSTNADRSDTCQTENRPSFSVKKESDTHSSSLPNKNDAMDIDRKAIDSDPPPELEYPPTESTDSDSAESITRILGTGQTAPQDPSQQAPANDDQRSSKSVRPRRQISSAFINYMVWREVIGEVKEKLAEGGKWNDCDIQERLSAFDLLPWWYDVNLKDSGGSEEDWEKWQVKIVDVWKRKRPGIPNGTLESMAEDLRELEQKTRPFRNLQCQVAAVAVKSESEDVEMVAADVPESPHLLPVWLPSSPPPEVRDAVKEANKEARIIKRDWVDLQERVWTLEKQVVDTTEELHDKLTRLGDRVHEDGITVADLKWRMAEIQELEEKAKTAGKRGYKKARGKMPTHRYPTRFSGFQADEVLTLGRKEFGDVAAKIQAVEERLEGMKTEKERLEAELTRVDALTTKIDALSSALEAFKTTQLKFNISTFQHFANLRDFYANTIGPRLDAHSREIAGLNARYNSLYAVAVDVLHPSQNGRRPPIAKPKRGPPAHPPTLANAFNKNTPLPTLRSAVPSF